MPKLFTEDITLDPSSRAENVLDAVLNDPAAQAEQANKAAVEEELRREQILKEESQRIHSRVLFVTRDIHVLEKDSKASLYYKNLEEVFDEVHVIVLGIRKKELPTQRLGEKVWVYPIRTGSFLMQPFAARALAKRELHFTDGFRPDIVVAKDAFEAGVAGYLIAKRFQRTFQVHILENFYTPSFKEEHERNGWRLQFAHYVLKRVHSVRVQTDTIKKEIKRRYPNIEDVALLPRFFHIQDTLKRSQTPLQKKLYPQFAFTILFVGVLDANSTLFRAIDAVRPLLRTPRIGLVVIGEGPRKEEFKARTQILGIQEQVLFVPKGDDVLPHMQSADILIQTDTDSESEEVIITAAAAGLPLIMARTTLRDDLFTDGVDAFLCDPEDTIDFSQKLTKFLNTNALRTQFSENARDVVRTRIEEDPMMYRLALRDSIEEALYQAEKKKQQTVENIKKAIEKENAEKAAKEQKRKQEEERRLQKKISPKGIEMKLPQQ